MSRMALREVAIVTRKSALLHGFKLGVTSTPMFFINSRSLVGAQPSAEFQAAIVRLLKQQPLS